MSDRLTILPKTKRTGIAADLGGCELKEYLAGKMRAAGHAVVDFGDGRPKADTDHKSTCTKPASFGLEIAG